MNAVGLELRPRGVLKMMKDLLENKEHPKGHAGPKAEH